MRERGLGHAVCEGGGYGAERHQMPLRPPRILCVKAFLFLFSPPHCSWNFTYSKSPGLLSMPAGGGAIHEAKAPGSVTGRIRLATKASSAADGRNSWRRRCHSSALRILP